MASSRKQTEQLNASGREFAHADKRAGHREALSRTTDDPPEEGSGRRMSGKQRSHKTKTRTGG